MRNPLLGALRSIAVFAYGIASVLLLWLQLARAGIYYKQPTKEEERELLLGMWPFIFCLSARSVSSHMQRHPVDRSRAPCM